MDWLIFKKLVFNPLYITNDQAYQLLEINHFKSTNGIIGFTVHEFGLRGKEVSDNFVTNLLIMLIQLTRQKTR